MSGMMTNDVHDRAVLKPHTVARYANMTPGALLVFLALALYRAPGAAEASLAMSGLVAALGVFLCVRMWRYSIVLEVDRMEVRGIFWSRTILRDAISSIGTFAWVRWTDPQGRIRRTPLTMFWTSGRSLPVFERALADGFNRVRAWAHA